MEPTPPPPPRNWLVEVTGKVRRRPDLLFGLAVLTVGTFVACWIGMRDVEWYYRVLVAALAVLTLGGMTLGMIHDYMDPDERDSREWLDQERRRSHGD